MKITDPAVEIIEERKPLKKIELCGRVCYKSEDRIADDSALKFVENILRRGHTSVLEHSRILVDSPYELSVISRRVKKQQKRFDSALQHRVARMGLYHLGFLTLNVRDYLVFFPDARLEEIDAHEDASDYLTVRFICDRAIANELVRHRVFSYSQESTRYVNYRGDMEFIRPLPFEWAGMVDRIFPDRAPGAANALAWMEACIVARSSYCKLIDAGCTPQEARIVLPLSTKTELIMTGTHEQWTEMLKLRLHPAAHPQMQYLMGLLVNHERFPKEKINVPEAKHEPNGRTEKTH